MALTCGCVGLCRVSRLSLSMRTWRVSENRTQPYTPPPTCGNAKQPYTARLTCKNTSQHHATAWRWLTVGPTADNCRATGYDQTPCLACDETVRVAAPTVAGEPAEPGRNP